MNQHLFLCVSIKEELVILWGYLLAIYGKKGEDMERRKKSIPRVRAVGKLQGKGAKCPW